MSVEQFGYEKLTVWQDAVNLVRDIHLLVRKFPKSELYALTNQIKRSTLSISLNIAEGKGRYSKKEFIQFLYIARGSAYETSTCLKVALDLGYASESEFFKVKSKLVSIEKQLNGLIKSIK